MAIWNKGYIASEPQLNYKNLPQFLIDCRTRCGQSGSPVIFHSNVIDSYGIRMLSTRTTTLLGIYSGRIHEDSDIGIVWKVEALKEMIDVLE